MSVAVNKPELQNLRIPYFFKNLGETLLLQSYLSYFWILILPLIVKAKGQSTSKESVQHKISETIFISLKFEQNQPFVCRLIYRFCIIYI